MSIEIKIDEKDQAWIDEEKDAALKEVRKNAILNLMEMNGLKFEPGIGKSYIPEKNYLQVFDNSAIPENVQKSITNALNWDALGRGIGGLAGAGVRMGLLALRDPKRECKTTVAITPEIMAVVRDFNEFVATRKDILPFWNAQCYNVLGLAGAIFNREMHHWNAENIKPQQALIGSLNQQDSIPENEFRKLFYLSIHPIPLAAMEDLRQKIVEGLIPGINDAVASRCRSAPASCGDIHACAQAIHDLRSEGFYNKFGNGIRDQIDELDNLNKKIMKDAASYHNFAANYKKQRIIIDKVTLKRSMACLCAYIMVNIKGSLAQSAALRKFRSNNARTVQKWISAFEATAQNIAETLDTLAAD